MLSQDNRIVQHKEFLCKNSTLISENVERLPSEAIGELSSEFPLGTFTFISFSWSEFPLDAKEKLWLLEIQQKGELGPAN